LGCIGLKFRQGVSCFSFVFIGLVASGTPLVSVLFCRPTLIYLPFQVPLTCRIILLVYSAGSIPPIDLRDFLEERDSNFMDIPLKMPQKTETGF
jgi:hypothetical protein